MKGLEQYEKETGEERLNRVREMTTVLNIGIKGKEKDVGLKLGDMHDMPTLIYAVASVLVILQKNLGMQPDEIRNCSFHEINKLIDAEFEESATIH